MEVMAECEAQSRGLLYLHKGGWRGNKFDNVVKLALSVNARAPSGSTGYALRRHILSRKGSIIAKCYRHQFSTYGTKQSNVAAFGTITAPRVQ